MRLLVVLVVVGCKHSPEGYCEPWSGYGLPATEIEFCSAENVNLGKPRTVDELVAFLAPAGFVRTHQAKATISGKREAEAREHTVGNISDEIELARDRDQLRWYALCGHPGTPNEHPGCMLGTRSDLLSAADATRAASLLDRLDQLVRRVRDNARPTRTACKDLTGSALALDLDPAGHLTGLLSPAIDRDKLTWGELLAHYGPLGDAPRVVAYRVVSHKAASETIVGPSAAGELVLELDVVDTATGTTLCTTKVTATSSREVKVSMNTETLHTDFASRAEADLVAQGEAAVARALPGLSIARSK